MMPESDWMQRFMGTKVRGQEKGTFVIYQNWTKMEYGNSKVRLDDICQAGIMKANPCYNAFCDY